LRSAERCDVQAEGRGGVGHAAIGGRKHRDVEAPRDCEVQGIERAQGVVGKSFDQIESFAHLPIRHRLDTQPAPLHIIQKTGKCLLLVVGVDLPGPKMTPDDTAEFENGQATDQDVRPHPEEGVDRVRAGLGQVALRQCAGVEVDLIPGNPDPPG